MQELKLVPAVCCVLWRCAAVGLPDEADIMAGIATDATGISSLQSGLETPDVALNLRKQGDSIVSGCSWARGYLGGLIQTEAATPMQQDEISTTILGRVDAAVVAPLGKSAGAASGTATAVLCQKPDSRVILKCACVITGVHAVTPTYTSQ